MAKIVEMPKLSPTMEEGVLTAWHKKEGDAVDVDDLLAEVETDKATMEFRSFDKGTLLRLLVADGANVKLGQPVAILGTPGEDIAALVAQAGATMRPAPEHAPKEAPTPAQPPSPPPREREPDTEAPSAMRNPPKLASGSVLDRTEREPEPVAAASGERVLASPYVRKTAREMGLDLRGVHGSGTGGRVVAGDLQGLGAQTRSTALARAAAPSTLQAPAAGPSYPEDEVRPLSMMRKTIARRLTEAKQTVPHFYLTVDVDMGPLLALREQINSELASEKTEDDKPLKVSVTDLLVKACASALVRVPECNASFTPEAILVHRRVDVSIAVAVTDGLLTPVVRNADQKSVVAIAREVRELAARARQKKLRPEEMSDGTFSISNLGMFGIDAFAAVINPPEGAILAVGQVREEPVVVDGALGIGKRMAMTLSCDHRVVDGAVGAAFLAELRALLARPMRVLAG